MYLTAGRNPTIELLRSSVECKSIYLEQGINKDPKIKEIEHLAQRRDVNVTFLKTREIRRKAGKGIVHQGVLAEAESFSPTLNLNKLQAERLGNQMYVHIREALYEHNAAAIIRTAECLGVSGVILPPKLRITPNLSRVAMGANFHIPIAKESLFNTIKLFKQAGYQTMAIEISGNKQISEIDYSIPTLFIVGGEDRSISEAIIEDTDHLAVIKQFGRVNSLNMSVAASLVMYERGRQLTADG